ncbi:proton channel OtopLc-like [Lineus longissimus]|uniref:proton channel OtopLc-like n=1 Tax=Lineus longissimus TaxID=88925 RepID=UPI00315D1CC8
MMALPRVRRTGIHRPSVISLGLARAGAKHVARRQEKRLSPTRARSGLTKLLCGMYCMVACVFGAVFPISDALAETGNGEHRYYTEMFHCFMYGLGVIAYIYFVSLIMHQRRKLKASGRYKDIELDVIGSAAPSRRVSRDYRKNSVTNMDIARRLIERDKERESPLGSINLENIDTDALHDKQMEELERDAEVTYEAEGVNFYLRLGAMGFGVGGMVQSGFRISEPFENPKSLHCRSLLFLVNAALYLVFVFLQTFFIFKYHKVVIHKHKAFVRFCLMHILATNLSVWLSTTTHETAEDIGRMSAKSLAMTAHNQTNDGADLMKYGANESDVGNSANQNDAVDRLINCHQTHTLSDRSAPYLFPCLIEYSLIGAAVAYRTFLNVGKRVAKGDSVDESAGMKQSVEPVECHKSNRGLFLGLIMLLITLVSVAMFFVFEEDKQKKDISTGIFLSSEIFLFVVSSCACIVGFFYTHRLSFIGLRDSDFFDDKLLLIAQMGVYLLSTCVVISSVTFLFSDPDREGHMTLPIMYLSMASLNFVQSSIQTVFILDGLRRCAGTDDHMTKKPGRAVITFLLVCNLAMWTVNTFEIKKAEVVADIHVDFFRYMPWSIIMHLCLPLVIFYRFHSSVCLSDVWHNAYVKRETQNIFDLSDILEESA